METIKNKIRIERIRCWLFIYKAELAMKPELYPKRDSNGKIILNFNGLSDNEIAKLYYMSSFHKVVSSHIRPYYNDELRENIKIAIDSLKYNSDLENPVDDFELQLYRCYIMCFIMIYSFTNPKIYEPIKYIDMVDKTIYEIEKMQDSQKILARRLNPNTSL